MHLFLTGEIQIGKSTVLQKTLSLLNVPYGGFRTYFGPDRDQPDRYLYINDAALPKSYGEENAVARFRMDGPPIVYTERFDMLGVSTITKAASQARLIVMDECGALEWEARRFQKCVMDTLDGDIPILGVVKKAARGWTDGIRSHPGVRVITVEPHNRDALPEELAGWFRDLC